MNVNRNETSQRRGHFQTFLLVTTKFPVTSEHRVQCIPVTTISGKVIQQEIKYQLYRFHGT
jgi:hypothetical protein